MWRKYAGFVWPRRNQAKNVSSGFYILRTKDTHNRPIQEVKQDPSKVALYGVKGPKTFASKKTTGGTTQENWCLIRLLPLMIGHHVPEGDGTWEVLMVLNVFNAEVHR